MSFFCFASLIVSPKRNLLFRAEQERLGKTSITYRISVFGQVKDSDPERVLFSTNMTFVNVDDQDRKQPI